jgi:hypothetical protein
MTGFIVSLPVSTGLGGQHRNDERGLRKPTAAEKLFAYPGAREFCAADFTVLRDRFDSA